MGWEAYGAQCGGAGAAALSWRWLSDYQIARVMNQDCRGLWSWHTLTHTSTLTGTRQIHTNTHSLHLYVNAHAPKKSRCADSRSRILIHKRVAVRSIHVRTCRHGHTRVSSSALLPTSGHRSWHMLLTAGCKDSSTHKNARVSSMLAVFSAHNRHKSSHGASTWTVVKRCSWGMTSPHPRSLLKMLHTSTWMFFFQHK